MEFKKPYQEKSLGFQHVPSPFISPMAGQTKVLVEQKNKGCQELLTYQSPKSKNTILKSKFSGKYEHKYIST